MAAKQIKPTVKDVRDSPEYYLDGSGAEQARLTDCEHGYALTSSCPACDGDR